MSQLLRGFDEQKIIKELRDYDNREAIAYIKALKYNAERWKEMFLDAAKQLLKNKNKTEHI